MFETIRPIELWLDLPTSLLQRSWQDSQGYPHPHQKWRAYLNQLSLVALLDYLEQDQDFPVRVWPSRESLPGFWGIVEGTMIELGGTKILLLPTENLDQDELRIPQEWVDIPNWRPDYYLALHLDLDDQVVGVGGHISHHQVKTRGKYDSGDRAYAIDGSDLTADFNVLLVSKQLSLSTVTQAEVSPLPQLPAIQAQNLLTRLGNPTNLVPRLMVPFSLWGALVEDSSYRDQLYQLSQGQASRVNPLNRLTAWLDNIFSADWQGLDQLNLAVSGQRSTTDTEIKRVKLVQLNPLDTEVVILIGIAAETEGRVGISLQLFPPVGQRYLPDQIEMRLATESGEILQSVQARSQDNYLKIRRFKAAQGFKFRIEIELGDAIYQEDFLV